MQGESSHDEHFHKGMHFEDKVAPQRHMKLWYIHYSEFRERYTIKSTIILLVFKCSNMNGGMCFWSLQGD